MANKQPFDDDMMTLIMGIEPDEPGQHGRTKVPSPDKDAIGIITQIKDLCEDFLMRAGKESDGEEEEEEGTRPTSESKGSKPSKRGFDIDEEEE